MEDAHTTLPSLLDGNTSFFAVYDGHGGSTVAKFAKETVHNRIINSENFEKGDYYNAIKAGFIQIDEDIKRDPSCIREPCGCTAVTILITSDYRVFCGNAGDSRCVLSSKGKAIPLSYDHKPTNREEVMRITEAGGFVQFGRVNGNLALSRAFGDFEFKKNPSLPPEKQSVTCDPEIIERQLTSDDEFIVLACDGIWDVMSNQMVVNFVRDRIASGKKLGEICEMLMDRCLAKDVSGVGCDNMSVIIVALLNNRTEEDLVKMCSIPLDNVTDNEPEYEEEEEEEVFYMENEKEPNFYPEPVVTIPQVKHASPQGSPRIHEDSSLSSAYQSSQFD